MSRLYVSFAIYIQQEGSVQYLPISDASLWQLAAAVYSPTQELLAWTKFPLPFKPDDDNLYQNAREFLGCLLSLILTLRVVGASSELGREVFIQWIGDNTASLAWAQTNACKGSASQVANMAFVWFQLYSNILARDTLHIAGISTAIHDVDAASRNKPCPSLLSHLYIGSCPCATPFLLLRHGIIIRLF